MSSTEAIKAQFQKISAFWHHYGPADWRAIDVAITIIEDWSGARFEFLVGDELKRSPALLKGQEQRAIFQEFRQLQTLYQVSGDDWITCRLHLKHTGQLKTRFFYEEQSDLDELVRTPMDELT